MLLTLSRFGRTRSATATAAPATMFESLEDRRLMSATLSFASAAAAVPHQGLNAALPGNVQAKAGQILNLNITGIVNQAGQLVAIGTIGNVPISLPLTLTASPNPADATCPILHLMLGPIHLNLLGLKVDTSAICLDITAQHGPGNLLGNLLCDVAGLLNGGTPLGTILGGLSGTQLNTLLGGLTGLLNSALGNLTSASSVTGVGGTTAGACDILNLSLGPVNLNLLGLNVALNNCANGPVTVAITAVPGAGNLLGNLLCNLSHLLDSNAASVAFDRSLARIADEIARLLA